MKKIAYLHGLESKTNCDKVKWLRSLGYEVLNPAIDYRNDPLERIITFVESFKPDLIIGSSMGGYLAYIISRRYNIPAMMLNPALHSRPFEPEVGPPGEHEPPMYFVFGEADNVLTQFSNDNSLFYTPEKKYLPFPQREIDNLPNFYNQNNGYEYRND